MIKLCHLVWTRPITLFRSSSFPFTFLSRKSNYFDAIINHLQRRFFIVYKAFIVFIVLYLTLLTNSLTPSEFKNPKGGSRHKNWCMARVLSYLIRYFSNYYTIHRSDLAAWAAPLDPRLNLDTWRPETKKFVLINQFMRM